MATSAEDSVVKLWDLRKLKNFKTIQLEDKYEVRPAGLKKKCKFVLYRYLFFYQINKEGLHSGMSLELPIHVIFGVARRLKNAGKSDFFFKVRQLHFFCLQNYFVEKLS